jgi:hypothetical protein
MPPPDSDVPPLTEDEKMTFARWVDLGCPITSRDAGRAPYGWFLDELRPTLTISSPRPGPTRGPVDELRIGLFDYYSGLEEGSLSVTADFDLDGVPAGTELAPRFDPVGPSIWAMPLSTPLEELEVGTLTVQVRDEAGNRKRLERTFSVVP